MTVSEAYEIVSKKLPNRKVISVFETPDSYLFSLKDFKGSIPAVNKETGKLTGYPTSLSFIEALNEKIIRKYNPSEVIEKSK